MAEVLAHAQQLPDLVVVDPALEASAPYPILQALRGLPWPGGGMPMVALSTATVDHNDLFDAVLPDIADPTGMAVAIMAWSPIGLLDGITRLAGVFGEREIDALVVRFRRQLAGAIAALDTIPDPIAAHQIAGIAGTLGFSRLGQSWLAVSEGDMAMCASARREARVADYALARAAHARRLLRSGSG